MAVFQLSRFYITFDETVTLMENSPQKVGRNKARMKYHIAESNKLSLLNGLKRSKTDRNWKKRIFILLSNVICVYKQANENSLEDEAISIVNIHIEEMNITTIARQQGKRTKCLISLPYKCEISSNIYHTIIKVYDEALAVEWFEAVKNQYNKIKTTLSRVDSSNKPSLLQESAELLINEGSGTIDKATADLYNLIKKIESMTELDKFTHLKTKIKNLLKHKQHTDLISTIDLCDRPCNMLAVDKDVNPDYDPRLYHKIEEIIDSLSKWVVRLKERGDEMLGKEILALKTFYEEEILRFQLIRYNQAKIPPITVIIGNSNSTPRIMSPEILEKILGGTRQKYGVSHVTYFNDIYWKKDPGQPAIEYAVDLASKLVTSQGSTPALLIKVVHYDPDTHEKNEMTLQASKSIEGYLVNELLNDHIHLISNIDRYNFSLVFIVALLTLPQDGKGDNIVASKNEHGKLILTGIDNDHAFSDEIVFRTKHFVNVKSILFCLPQADEIIDRKARKRILSLSPALTTISWLSGLNEQNQFYLRLKEEGFLNKEDCENMKLPIKLRKGTASAFYKTLVKIQYLLNQSKDITLNQIFEYVYPELFAYYDYVMKQPGARDNINATFSKYIFSGDYFEDIPELMEREIIRNDKTMKIKDALSFYDKSPTDYIDQRDHLPFEDLEDLLTVIDLSNMNQEEEQKFIRFLFSFSFVKFTLNGSKYFDGHDLKAIIEKSPSLVHLELNHCKKITAEDLKILIVKRCQPIVYLSGTSITTEEIKDLVNLKLNIVIKDEDSTIIQPIEPSLNHKIVVMPQIVKALEFIRNGRFSLAASRLQSVLKDHPGLLKKYSQHINGLISNSNALDVFNSKSKRFISLMIQEINWDINQYISNGKNGWHYSVEEGDINWCKELVSLNIDVNKKTIHEERNVLHLAIVQNNYEMVNYLLTLEDLDIDAMDKDNNSPLSLSLLSSSKSKEAIALLLLDKGASIEGQYGIEKNTILHLAAQMRLMKVALKVLERGANINEVNANGESPLHIACLHRCKDSNGSLISILIERGSNIGAKTLKMCTPFHYAVRGASKSILRYLMMKAPHIARQCDYQQYNLLHEAVRQREWVATHVLPLLLEYMKDNIEDRTIHHKTPLMIASQANHINIKAMKLLIDAGANVNAIDGSGDTILMWAINSGDLKLTKFLIESGADPNIFNTNGISPMWRSILNLYREDPFGITRRESFVKPDNPSFNPEFSNIAEYLYENGGIFDQPNESGDYVIHTISQRILKDPLHCSGILELNFLIKNKFDLTVKDSNQRTFLHILLHKKVIGTDEKRRINNVINAMYVYFNGILPMKPSEIIYQEDIDGNTVLHNAVDSNCIEYVEKLLEQDGYEDYVLKNQKKRGEHNPLYIAVKNDSEEMVKLLISKLINYMKTWEIKIYIEMAKKKKNVIITEILNNCLQVLKDAKKRLIKKKSISKTT